MKEQTLLEMKNKIETLGRVAQQMSMELSNLRDLAIGTMETLKRVDGYEQALQKLKEEHVKRIEETKSDRAAGAASGTNETNLGDSPLSD